ncbi:MAG: YicC/YloC family endoribonuclease [Bacillota bacterium]
MAILSMTGFGRTEKRASDLTLVMEMKTLNHRYLDISVSLPRMIPQAWEMDVRRAVEHRLRRGRVDFSVNLETGAGGNWRPRVDTALAGEYHESLKELCEEQGLVFDLSLPLLISLPGVVEVEEISPDLRDLKAVFDAALAEVMDQVVEMRSVEGADLGRKLGRLLEDFEANLARVETAAPGVEKRRFEAVLRRVRQLLDEEAVVPDELDIRGEVALAVQRTSISEEMARLRSHVQQFRGTLTDGEGSGRKLEFLAGEMSRETNTVAAKISDAALSGVAIEMKRILEDVREQLRNIE